MDNEACKSKYVFPNNGLHFDFHDFSEKINEREKQLSDGV